MTGTRSPSTHPLSTHHFSTVLRAVRALPLSALLALAVMVASTVPARAINADVKSACTSDYFRHCSQHAVGSNELRQCMRKVGEDLSTPCLVALVKAGEVTKAEIEAYKAKQAGGPAVPAAQAATKAAAKATAAPARAARPPTNSAKAATPAKAMAQTKTPTKALARVKAAKAVATKTAAVKAKAKSIPPAKTAATTTMGKGKPDASPTKAAPARAAVQAKVAKPYSPASSAPGGPVPQVAGWASPGADAGATPAYTHNLCRATTLGGEVETFTCGLDERCCYGALFNEKYCVPLSKSCF